MTSEHISLDETPASRELGLERIVFFSDAVMAIAITLLAIDIRAPEVAAALAPSVLPTQLSELTPRIMSFVISFVVISIYWMSHHRYFSFIRRYDGVLMVLNLLFLLFIAAMPFVASLLGQYAYLPLGIVSYAIEVAAIGLSLSAVWWYASHSHRLVDKSLDPRLIRAMNARALGAPILFLLSIPLAFLSLYWAVALWCISPLAVSVAARLARRMQA
jgi:uncharacterized membrane protein